MTALESFDPRQLRNVLGRFYTGVTVVTTLDKDGKPWGVTANSFTSVSLEPPLVLWNQGLQSDSLNVFMESDRFNVNILAEDQMALSNQFARTGTEKFVGVAVERGLGGLPVLDGCCAVLECSKFASHDGGDHVIYIGKVERITSSDKKPLLFGDGKYMRALPVEE